ncbi:MAG: AtpZ/AtpI family protein [Planctomycetaceae bacterium]|nr:AtpZ/AtpI family protein [Planctomycetaceae bacterium]
MPRQDSEPPMAVAAFWVSRISSISLEMVLPVGLGYWLDRRWGTEPWLVSVGACLGMFVAMVSLVRLSQQANSKTSPKSKKNSLSADCREEQPAQDLNQQQDSDQPS